jgi:hypothetical protein
MKVEDITNLDHVKVEEEDNEETVNIIIIKFTTLDGRVKICVSSLRG